VRQARTGRHVRQLPGEVDGSEPDTDAGWRLPPEPAGRSPQPQPTARRRPSGGVRATVGHPGVKPHDG